MSHDRKNYKPPTQGNINNKLFKNPKIIFFETLAILK
jgi:hypothetical protein